MHLFKYGSVTKTILNFNKIRCIKKKKEKVAVRTSISKEERVY